MNAKLPIVRHPLLRLFAAAPQAPGTVKLIRAATLSLLIAWLAGCAADSGGKVDRRGSSRDSVDELHLFSLPRALDFDGKSGPDGFAVRIYASNRNQAKAIPIKRGTLEILMFDGILTEQNSAAQKPSRVWTFTASELKNHGSKSEIGIGYRFALRWGDAAPTRDRITIVARYSSPQGQISSPPCTISVSAK